MGNPASCVLPVSSLPDIASARWKSRPDGTPESLPVLSMPSTESIVAVTPCGGFANVSEHPIRIGLARTRQGPTETSHRLNGPARRRRANIPLAAFRPTLVLARQLVASGQQSRCTLHCNRG